MGHPTPIDGAAPGRAAAVAAGGLAAAVALAAGHVAGALTTETRSPVVVVGEGVIERVPVSVERFAIETFGSNDKLALVVGISAVCIALGALLGLLVRRRPAFAGAGFAVFEMPTEQPKGDGLRSRRAFLVASGAALAGVALLRTAGSAMAGRFSAAASRAGITLPRAARPLPAAPVEVEAGVDGITPFFTPNLDFYRVDTALVVPYLPAESWQLRIHGLVDRPMAVTFDELLRRQLVEADITLTCVSNTVGGKLVGNARWLGVLLRELLDEAGVRPEADQIVGRSSDGWTCGFPMAAAYDRNALVALGMNGEPLPLEHGFPARLITPGLYGYVSATKWLTEIELTTFDAFDQYWVRRGWDKDAPIKTMTRIDTPRSLARVPAAPLTIGGVAWAQTRGIEQVEVRIDDGPWQTAQLADALNLDTWRQWTLAWNPEPGRHTITARATDGTGERQTDERAEPFPNGASGWQSLLVTVEEPAT